jgi:hypothetical protein
VVGLEEVEMEGLEAGVLEDFVVQMVLMDFD